MYHSVWQQLNFKKKLQNELQNVPYRTVQVLLIRHAVPRVYGTKLPRLLPHTYIRMSEQKNLRENVSVSNASYYY